MSKKGKILLAVTGWDPIVWKRELEKCAPDREVLLEPEGDVDPSIHYAVVWKQQPSLLSKLPNLKAIFSLGAGVDHIFHDDNLPDVPIGRIVSPDLTMRMSEYVIWRVLDHHRHGALYRQHQTAHQWNEIENQPPASKVTVGIMGMGELGRDAAQKLGLLGFRVTAWSRRPQQVDGVECYHGAGGFDGFLASANIFVVLLPLTPETRGILNLRTFGRMTRYDHFGAPVVINAGRGGLQVESDIIQALDDGVLSAVSLDVFEHEPLPENSPLWDHPKITITPHAAASSSPSALVGSIVDEMDACDRGEQIANLVNKSAGY